MLLHSTLSGYLLVGIAGLYLFISLSPRGRALEGHQIDPQSISRKGGGKEWGGEKKGVKGGGKGSQGPGQQFSLVSMVLPSC